MNESWREASTQLFVTGHENTTSQKKPLSETCLKDVRANSHDNESATDDDDCIYDEPTQAFVSEAVIKVKQFSNSVENSNKCLKDSTQTDVFKKAVGMVQSPTQMPHVVSNCKDTAVNFSSIYDEPTQAFEHLQDCITKEKFIDQPVRNTVINVNITNDVFEQKKFVDQPVENTVTNVNYKNVKEMQSIFEEPTQAWLPNKEIEGAQNVSNYVSGYDEPTQVIRDDSDEDVVITQNCSKLNIKHLSETTIAKINLGNESNASDTKKLSVEDAGNVKQIESAEMADNSTKTSTVNSNDEKCNETKDVDPFAMDETDNESEEFYFSMKKKAVKRSVKVVLSDSSDSVLETPKKQSKITSKTKVDTSTNKTDKASVLEATHSSAVEQSGSPQITANGGKNTNSKKAGSNEKEFETKKDKSCSKSNMVHAGTARRKSNENEELQGASSDDLISLSKIDSKIKKSGRKSSAITNVEEDNLMTQPYANKRTPIKTYQKSPLKQCSYKQIPANISEKDRCDFMATQAYAVLTPVKTKSEENSTSESVQKGKMNRKLVKKVNSNQVIDQGNKSDFVSSAQHETVLNEPSSAKNNNAKLKQKQIRKSTLKKKYVSVDYLSSATEADDDDLVFAKKSVVNKSKIEVIAQSSENDVKNVIALTKSASLTSGDIMSVEPLKTEIEENVSVKKLDATKYLDSCLTKGRGRSRKSKVSNDIAAETDSHCNSNNNINGIMKKGLLSKDLKLATQGQKKNSKIIEASVIETAVSDVRSNSSSGKIGEKETKAGMENGNKGDTLKLISNDESKHEHESASPLFQKKLQKRKQSQRLDILSEHEGTDGETGSSKKNSSSVQISPRIKEVRS